jgi:hypothetical protein
MLGADQGKVIGRPRKIRHCFGLDEIVPQYPGKD